MDETVCLGSKWIGLRLTYSFQANKDFPNNESFKMAKFVKIVLHISSYTAVKTIINRSLLLLLIVVTVTDSLIILIDQSAISGSSFFKTIRNFLCLKVMMICLHPS